MLNWGILAPESEFCNHQNILTSWLLFSCSDMSNSLQPHGLQHAALPCPSLSPRVCLNSCLLSQWCHPTISSPLLPPAPPTLNLSHHQSLFQWVGSLHQVTKYWSFSLCPSDEYSGFIFFKIDWFDLLAVQGTLKSLLQDHSLKASILQCSAFFMVQLSHPYMTTGKTIALTIIRTFVGKVMPLLFNTLSGFVIAFLPRRKRLLISSLQSPSTVILEPKKRKSVTVSIVSPSICHEVMGPDALILIF